MSVPLSARDRLHALFVSVLGRADAPEAFARAAPSMREPGAESFVDERLPRYLRVLELFRGRPEPGPLELWRALFENGLYFDAHECLEGPWREASGSRRRALQGLIQAAAAFHKLELDPGAAAGARRLLERALEKLES